MGLVMKVVLNYHTRSRSWFLLGFQPQFYIGIQTRGLQCGTAGYTKEWDEMQDGGIAGMQEVKFFVFVFPASCSAPERGISSAFPLLLLILVLVLFSSLSIVCCLRAVMLTQL